MYSGEQLGEAIRIAVKRKGVTQKEVAKTFGIKQQSISAWLKNGRVSKEHIGKLIEYFSDVVPPSHFGIDNLVLNSGIQNSQNSGGTTNNTVINGDQTNNTTNNFFSTQHGEEIQEILNKEQSRFWTIMPILGIDDGVGYAVNPKEKLNKIKDISERAATYIPHSDRTFALKLAEEISGITSCPLFQNDILIVEPLIPPRDKDLVLVCLAFRLPEQRGILARLFIDIQGSKSIQLNESTIVPLPQDALICGVIVEIKRRLLPNDLVKSRIDVHYEPSKTQQQ